MIGRTLGGKYKIYDKVGGGGMAEVYLARDITKGQIVALKILRDQYTQGSDYIERFRREAESAIKLKHENICEVMDFGNEDQIYYMVMEFIEGRTLSSIIEQQGPMPLGESLNIMTQAVRALDKAYKTGIIAHRDIKSQNLMVTPNGVVKIMDFGIAKSRDFATMTTAGSFIGTPEYMSPEQAQGLKVDARTDFYSLGVVMYEMLAGEVPFESDTPWGVLNMHINKEPFPLNNLRKDVPSEVVDIIGHMMAKNPDDRYQNTAEMLSALSVLAVKYGGAKQTIIKTKKVPRSNPRVKRNIVKIIIIVTSIAILTGGFVFGWQLLKPKPGNITVTSVPSGATIMLKGLSENDYKTYGKTPSSIKYLNPGAYDLKLHIDGYVDSQSQVEVKSGENPVTDPFQLVKPGKLSVISGQTLDWGKVETIPAPKQIVIKNVGQHKLVIDKTIDAGWISIDSGQITLDPGITKQIPVSIDPSNIKPGQNYSGKITLKPDTGDFATVNLMLSFSSSGKVDVDDNGNTGSTGNIGNTGNTGSQKPPPLQPKEGTIVISCNVVAAQIKVNGVAVGTGSVTIKKMPGSYKIEIVAPGYKSPPKFTSFVYAQTVNVSVNETTKVQVTFRK